MRAPHLVAADGGADTVRAAGLLPSLVIGDFDSISEASKSAFSDRLTHIAEQDSTDFAKALRTSRAELTIAVGFLGARLDHTLACLTELARNPAPVVLLGSDDCVCILPPHLQVSLAAGARVSLWPLARATGRSIGLRWPIDGLVLDPVGQVSTSNEATGPVTIWVNGGPVALILPEYALDDLLQGLGFDTRGAGQGGV